MRSAVPIAAKAHKCKMLTVLRFEPELRTVQKCRPGARPICISEGFYRAIPIAVMPMPFHLNSEIEKQLGIRFATEFRFLRDVAQAHDEY